MTDLKNIRQIGLPSGTNRVYIENRAYERLHREDRKQLRVFVLMGRTEKGKDGYTTFVEAIIPVYDMEFVQGLPHWNSRVWNQVFGEVKTHYDNSIIVGWAFDAKGIPPKMGPDLERIHKEQFGGVHQLLLLMDSMEQEEVFFQMKGGLLRSKEGFYIYYDEALPQVKENPAERTEKPVDSNVTIGGELGIRARYRESVYREDVQPKGTRKRGYGSWAMATAAVLFCAILGTAFYQGRIPLDGVEQLAETMTKPKNVISRETEASSESATDVQNRKNTEPETQTETEFITDVESIQELLEEWSKLQEDSSIPLEEISGGDIVSK